MAGASGGQTRRRHVFGRLVLDIQLRTVEAFRLELRSAGGITLGFRRTGLQFRHRGPRFGQFNVDGITGDTGQHLTFFDLIANLNAHFSDPVIADLRPDHGFLPGDDAAIGGQHLRPVEFFRRYQADR